MGTRTEMQIKRLTKKFEEAWLEEIANEVETARTTIIDTLKPMKLHLPSVTLALDLVKMELVRGQLAEFMGHVKLSKELPLKATAKAE
ncbi:unnamed protein product [marine sediment metagenome]|uniref:Uncharacterized protein n=1 Tax=marine sediment metagenome TaxID=412755 RepID=X1KIF9_9ZZZZ